MKNLTKIFVSALICAFILVGCAKEPIQEITDAKTAVEAAIQAGASTYTPAEIQALNASLIAVMEEAKNKAGKLFASNKEATEKLIKIKTDAEALVTTVAAKKEEAKNNSGTALNDAKTALEEAKTLVTKAPKGKGTKADIAAFNADISALEASLPEIQTAIDGGDFLGAIEKANTIKEKATAISDQIKQAMEKTGAAK